LGFFSKKTHSVSELIAMFESDNIETRTGAVVELAFMDPLPFDELLDALKNGTPFTRECAAAALGKSGDARAIEPVREVYKYDNNQAVCARAREALDRLEGRM